MSLLLVGLDGVDKVALRSGSVFLDRRNGAVGKKVADLEFEGKNRFGGGFRIIGRLF